jgi:hypothetical protein
MHPSSHHPRRRFLMQTVLALVLASLVLVFAQCSSGGDKSGKSGKKDKKRLKAVSGSAFQDGTYEASGVVAVPGTDGVLFVDDNHGRKVFWMRLTPSGEPSGSIKEVALDLSIDDPESITTDGKYFYMLGSQASPKAGKREGLLRFSFDPATQTATNQGVIVGLREFLLQHVPELQNTADLKGEEGGLNIEGMAWDPVRARLLLGLRSPLVNDNALIVALNLRDGNGAFAVDNLQLAEPSAMQLGFDGLGIRDIQYDSRLKSFLIISGAPEHHEKTTFTLWAWNGDANQLNPEAQPHEMTPLDPKMKPEGVTRVTFEGHEFIFIVGDASRYLKLDYVDE